MSGTGKYEEPYILHEGGHALTPRIEDLNTTASRPQLWPEILISEAEAHYKNLGTTESLTFDMVLDYLTNVRKESAGPDSHIQIKLTLEYRNQKRAEANTET